MNLMQWFDAGASRSDSVKMSSVTCCSATLAMRNSNASWAMKNWTHYYDASTFEHWRGLLPDSAAVDAAAAAVHNDSKKIAEMTGRRRPRPLHS